MKNFRRNRKGKGKGKGKTKGQSFMWTHEETLTYLKGRGKGSRAHTSGKGHGRRKNPKDRQGNIMRCRICNSDEHFAARCPQGKGKGKGGSASSMGPVTFTGLAFDPENVRQTASGSQQAEAGGPPREISRSTHGQYRPPWEDEDLMFDTTHGQASYPAFSE